MNKRQKEVEFAKLRDEKKVLDALKKQYEEAAKDVQAKIHIHDNKIDIMLNEWDEIDDEKRSILQSQIYQKNFQRNLKAQIDDTVKKLNAGQYGSIEEYLNDTYKTAWAGNAYDLHGQGIPLIMPIDKKAMLKAVELDPKLSNKLYGSYMNEMKDNIRAEISRGIATADSFDHIARNISSKTNQGFNKTMRIVRTEGHRIQIEAAFEQQKKAKAAGADILKQWDATMDKRTRASHREVDGEIRELDERFSNGLKYPADSAGGAAEVVNCRCSLLQRAKWALDEEELETQKKRAEYFGLDKTENFNDFKKKYLKAAETVATGAAAVSAARVATSTEKALKNQEESGIINVEIDDFTPCLVDSKTGEVLATTVGEITDRSILKQYNENNGWFINWNEVPEDCTVCALKIKGIDDVQGLVAYNVDPANYAVRGHWIVAAPHNRGADKKYNGVGGHLFAVMLDASVDAGFDGFFYGTAANKQLLEHYVEKMGAEPIGGLRFCIDEKNAHKLLETYDFERE